MGKKIAFLVLLAALHPSMVLAAKTTSRVSVDLDGAAPAELIEKLADGHSRLLFWSSESASWLELFRTSGAGGIDLLEDPRSSLKMLQADGRSWQWRNEGYVPLVGEVVSPKGQLGERDYARAVQALDAHFDQIPPRSMVDGVYALDLEGAGELTTGVFLRQGELCALGGSLCPLILMSLKGADRRVDLDAGLPWGISSAKGPSGVRQIEEQRATSVEQIDPITGASGEIEMVRPKAAGEAPYAPRGTR